MKLAHLNCFRQATPQTGLYVKQAGTTSSGHVLTSDSCGGMSLVGLIARTLYEVPCLMDLLSGDSHKALMKDLHFLHAFQHSLARAVMLPDSGNLACGQIDNIYFWSFSLKYSKYAVYTLHARRGLLRAAFGVRSAINCNS